jgi:hypothetical protein
MDMLVGETEWGEAETGEGKYFFALAESDIIWANHDVLHEYNNEICLSASEPIPVYE